MSNVVTCTCGKKLRLPEGTTARAVRCPGCQAVIRLDEATTAAKPPVTAPTPPAKPPAPPSPKPVPPPRAAVATAQVPPPAPKPAAPMPPAALPSPAKLIKDPPNVWLYVKDPALIARAESADGGRQTTLRTFGPGDDPLTELDVSDADDLRAYLGKQEYIAWVGQPSRRDAGKMNWMAYLLGGIFIAAGLGIALMGLLLPTTVTAVRIVLPLFGVVFAGAGAFVLVVMLRGGVVTQGTMKGYYFLTNRRAIVWQSKSVVRSFTGPMLQNMRREVKLENEDDDFGDLLFTHGLDGNPAGPGFCNVEKVSEVEDLVRGYLIDRVLEKSAAGDGPRLVPMQGPNPFAKDDKGAKKPPKKLELWQAAALAMELEKDLTPEMIAAANEHTDGVLAGAELERSNVNQVRDELQPGETIVWVGRPDVGMIGKRAWLVTYIGLGVGAFLLAVLGGIAFGTDVARGGTFGVMMAVLGLVAVVGPAGALGFPFYAKWRAARTFYVLTSRRALTWEADWKGAAELEAYGPRDLSNLHTVGGDVVFRTLTTITKSKQGTTTSTQRFGFLAQKDAPAVERLVRATLVEPFLEKAYE